MMFLLFVSFSSLHLTVLAYIWNLRTYDSV